ncbi:hypothetical protein IWX90DRAFT_424446 [Phyllosticta citrichinensis]|uniref:TauD/TfdA-like domain-containing protein n=1 Tax=Phyllosticta citrichinensis TaxID=1130410 RepID=A0ABR1Y371_9PEZI
MLRSSFKAGAKNTLGSLRRPKWSANQTNLSQVQQRRSTAAASPLKASIEHPEPVTNGPSRGLSGDLPQSEKALTSMVLSLNAKQIRDSCTCPQCVDPSSSQKSYHTTDIPENIQPKARLANGDSRVIEVKWQNDIPNWSNNHVTQFYRNNAEAKDTIYHPIAPVDRRIWDAKKVRQVSEQKAFIDFHDYVHNDETLHKALEQIGRWGIVFLKNVPDSEKAIESITSRIGLLKETFYGRTWDVKSMPQAKNIAYTHQYLGLHQDLMYVSNPPHLQILHSLRARAPGGESMFADGFWAAFELLKRDRAAFDALCTHKVPFHYHNDSQSYVKWRPTIELGARTNPTTPVVRPEQEEADAAAMPAFSADTPADLGLHAINYSPPFQAPWLATQTGHHAFPSAQNQPLSRSQFDELFSALSRYRRILEDPANMLELRLEEGQAVVFDNRRVLHARREFDATKGERWLKGAYVDDDVFYSRWRVLAAKMSGAEREEEEMRKVLYGGQRA